MRRKGATNSRRIWNELTVNRINADISCLMFEFMLA